MQNAVAIWALCLALKGNSLSSEMQVGNNLLHSSAPARNMWFGYMGKHSLNFIQFLE